jgi:hypothetical protein
MKAVNKGSPSMGAVKRQTEGIQQNAVQRLNDPLASAEKDRQRRETILGGGGSGDRLG